MYRLRYFRLFVIVIFCILITSLVHAQDSSRLRVSLLTCTPGAELYSIFGHSALRVIDSNQVTDHVFNYGTFNFEDEGFYLKFARGKLLYYVSLERFDDFVWAYQQENRGITEQVLNLSGAEKKSLQKFLHENLREENKYYRYDFFLDNCTTRLRDILLNAKNPNPVLPATLPPDTRFRKAIHAYLDKGHQPWSKLGIDILLGLPTDRIMSSRQQQFLPDNLMKALDSSKPSGLVMQKNSIIQQSQNESSYFSFTPFMAMALLCLLMFGLSMAKKNEEYGLLHRLDGLVFFITGMLGVLLLFMWFGTDHAMTKWNLNLLWAWPTHIFMAFFLHNKSKFARIYWRITSIILAILLVSWYFIPQQLNLALWPFVLILAYRAWVMSLPGKT